MNISSSIARLQRETTFLLTFGLAAVGSGAWLLHTAPAGVTADALARVETRLTPAEGSAAARPMAGIPVAMRDGAGFSMRNERMPSDADFVVEVEVRAQVSGRVASIRFEPGAFVEKGETLFVLDPTPFADALEHAESSMASARAKLGAATAELGRAQRAFDDGAITRQALDARVRAQRDAHGALRAAAAVLENARRDLALTRIAAPIDGRVAAVQVNVGDRVAAGPDARALITIVSADPVYARGSGAGASGIVRLAQAH